MDGYAQQFTSDKSGKSRGVVHRVLVCFGAIGAAWRLQINLNSRERLVHEVVGGKGDRGLSMCMTLPASQTVKRRERNTEYQACGRLHTLVFRVCCQPGSQRVEGLDARYRLTCCGLHP